ncbi:MAG: GNAT family N-acetyltransferase, partial [Chlamydiia bacterium]|nr:GNAT family N-acetyltransferase [Chlamydiia bacterium]
ARDLPSFEGRKNKKPKVYLSHLVTTPQTKEQGAVTALLKKAMEVAEDRLYLHCHEMIQYKNFAESEDLDWKGRDCGRYMDGSPKIEMKLTKPHLTSTLDFFETKPNTYSYIDTIDIIEKIHGNAPISNRDIQSLAEAIKHNTMQIFWALDKNGDVIGYAAYRPDARDLPSFQGGKNKKPKVYLSYLTVTPEARSNGVGSALLAKVLEVAQGRLYLHPAGKAWYEIFAEKYDVAFIEKNCGTYSDGSPKIVMKLEARDAEL